MRLMALPVWKYLNQNLGDRSSVWSVKRFWLCYKVELLKKCWQQEHSAESYPQR